MTGPLPAWLVPLTVPASWVYGRAIALRNRRLDKAQAGRVGLPVISVGNISAGGVGKTPLVAFLADLLRGAGHQPVIAMRGYGPKSPDDGRSDEQAEYATRLPDIPVVADPDRLCALRQRLPELPEADCVLLDDGFQHRRLHRDLDLVLIDGSVPLSSQRLLPWGFLREPPSGLGRADAVIVTHAASVDDALAGEIDRHHGRPPIAWSRHHWKGLTLRNKTDEVRHSVDPSWLEGKRLLTLLGIGKPQSVIDRLTALGADVVVSVPARDHQRYRPGRLATIRGLCQGVDAMVVTAKDWVKLSSLIDLSTWPGPIVVPELTIDVFRGEEALRDLVLRTARDHADD